MKNKKNIYNKIIDLLIEFDEMGFLPLVFCGDAENYAKSWKNRLVQCIDLLYKGV